MRVTLLHVNFPDVVAAQADALAGLVELTVLQPASMRDRFTAAIDGPVEVVSFEKPRIRSPRSLLAVRELRMLVAGTRPDVVHVHETGDPWLDLALATGLLRCDVLTVHDIEQHPGDGDQAPLTGLTSRLARRRARHLIAHTEPMVEALRASGHRAVHLVPLGEHAHAYRRFSADGATRPGSLLFFGRIWPYKGLGDLLAAMPAVRASVPGATLTVAGRGQPIGDYLPDGIPPWCTVHDDWIADQEVVDLFSAADVVVLPYREASQSGVALLAYGFGCPVVATRTGGLAELVADGHDGLLVPPASPEALADALVSVLTDRELRNRLAAGARRRVDTDLSWSGIADRTVEVYRAVVSE